MSPPIRDGSGSSIGSIRLGDGSEIAEVRTGAGDVLFSAIPDSGVSRYRFEDNGDTTTVTDVWGNNVGSINYNTSYSTSSYEGSYALSFTQEALTTSNDEPVSFGDVFDYGLSQSFSVVTWVNTTNSNPQFPLGKHDVQGGSRPGWNLDIGYRGSDGQVTFEFQDSGGKVTATSSATVNDASYHLIGGVHDASTSTIYIYIGGTQEGSADVFGIGSITNNEPFVIGSSSMNNDSGAYTYGGLQDDVRVYDKALSSTEMSNLNSTGSIDG